MSEKLFSDFGDMPGETLRELYRQASRTVNDHTLSMDELRMQLQEENSAGGARLCEYDFFKILYRMQARAVARMGIAVHICLLSVTAKDGSALARRSLELCLPVVCWVQAEVSDERTISTGHCYLEVVQKALQEVDAGHIGNYDSCMSVSPVTGYWRPLDGCDPYIGTNGEISCEPELKVEVTVYTENVDKTIEAVKKVHPYEEPVINVIPLWRTSF